MCVDVGMTRRRQTDSDRRMRPRISVAVELKLHAPEHRFVLLSRTVDLSSTGAFIRTSRRLPEGAEVVVAFQRGTQRNPLTLNADVVRAGLADGGRSTGIALQFKQTSELDESLLRDLIDRHLS